MGLVVYSAMGSVGKAVCKGFTLFIRLEENSVELSSNMTAITASCVITFSLPASRSFATSSRWCRQRPPCYSETGLNGLRGREFIARS